MGVVTIKSVYKHKDSTVRIYFDVSNANWLGARRGVRPQGESLGGARADVGVMR